MASGVKFPQMCSWGTKNIINRRLFFNKLHDSNCFAFRDRLLPERFPGYNLRYQSKLHKYSMLFNLRRINLTFILPIFIIRGLTLICLIVYKLKSIISVVTIKTLGRKCRTQWPLNVSTVFTRNKAIIGKIAKLSTSSTWQFIPTVLYSSTLL